MNHSVLLGHSPVFNFGISGGTVPGKPLYPVYSGIYSTRVEPGLSLDAVGGLNISAGLMSNYLMGKALFKKKLSLSRVPKLFLSVSMVLRGSPAYDNWPQGIDTGLIVYNHLGELV